jgi:hypothetical protein
MLGRARDPKATSKSMAARRPPQAWNVWRQAGWGLAAMAALFVAVLSSRDDLATQRVGALLLSFNLMPAQPAAPKFDAESAARQLAKALHGLVEDRDRLATRLASLERDMDDRTGSIKNQIEAVRTAKTEAPPWPDNAPPVPMTPADIAAMVKPVSPAPAAAAANPPPSGPPAAAADPSPADVSPSTATAYGADIGTALTMKALHARWSGLRAAHPALFDGLQPLVSLKQNPRTNRTELHLVVGPYSNADAAAQFCDFVLPFHLACQPAMFDGSRLALQ